MFSSVKKACHGYIEVNWVVNGIWMPVWSQTNLILYSGYDIMARAVGGDQLVNGMYFEFSNAVAPPTPPAIAKDRKTDYYESLSGDLGYVRNVTVGRVPVFDTSGTDYQNNRVTFMGIADRAAETSGAAVIDNVSQFYSVALVSVPDLADRTQDTLFSAGNLATVLTKPANAHIGVRWTIEFADA